MKNCYIYVALHKTSDDIMDIQLPHKSNGQEADVLRNARQITIIGANGSGKTRFCNWVLQQYPDKAYRISALRALFATSLKPKLKGSIDDIYDKINEMSTLDKGVAATEFDRLVYIMMVDEFRDLMNYKAHLLMQEHTEFPKTKLDTVVKMWQQVFPKNKVLRENGKLLFSTEGQEDRYTSLRLSDGEKTVLYYIGAVLYAMPGAVVLVDDPEVFIHQSMMSTLWNAIEEMRPDCTFVYNTHDIDFATSRIDNQCVWVKSFDPAASTWDYVVMPSSAKLDDGLYYDLLGSRKPVLFVEGDDTHLLRIKCGKGVYIRTLCHDIGQTLGCGGCMSSLRRTRAGIYSLSDAHSLIDVQAAAEQGAAETLLLSIDSLFADHPVLRVGEREEARIRNGNSIPAAVPDGVYRVYGPRGDFLALDKVEGREMKTIKSFFEV